MVDLLHELTELANGHLSIRARVDLGIQRAGDGESSPATLSDMGMDLLLLFPSLIVGRRDISR
jgi:hypothetical protein